MALDLFRLFGTLCMTAAALGSVLFLLRWEARRKAELSGLLSLLSTVKSGILLRSLPLSEIFLGFEEPALSACGFLEALRSGGLRFALDGGFLSFSREELSFLYRYAEGLGERFLCEEETAVTEALGALSALIAEESEEKKKSYKRRRTLILTGTGMLLLLLV